MLKTLLVLDSAWQHMAISMFHVRRPTSVIVHLQLLGQHHRTDYQWQSGHLTLFRISRTNWKLTSSDGPFFLFHSFRTQAPRIGLHVTAPEKLTLYYYVIIRLRHAFSRPRLVRVPKPRLDFLWPSLKLKVQCQHNGLSLLQNSLPMSQYQQGLNCLAVSAFMNIFWHLLAEKLLRPKLWGELNFKTVSDLRNSKAWWMKFIYSTA